MDTLVLLPISIMAFCFICIVWALHGIIKDLPAFRNKRDEM